MLNFINTNFLVITITFMLLNHPTYAQVPTSPCTSSMLTSFTPCISYLTNSSTSTGTSPTNDCCNSLKSLMRNGSGCICQIFTGGVPFRIPINRTLAIALPKACNQPGVPVQCKASTGASSPAPGPTTALGPSTSPAAVLSSGPSGSTIPETKAPALSPVSETTPSTDGSVSTTPTSSGTGTSSTPASSAAMLSLCSPALFLCSMGILMMKFF